MMVPLEKYPLMKAMGLEPVHITFVPWSALVNKMTGEQYIRFKNRMRSQACIEQGPYPWDVERFLRDYLIID